MPNWYGGGKLSCCCKCFEVIDPFDRADSDTPANGWTEVSGDWDISSNKLVISGIGVISRNGDPTAGPDGTAQYEWEVTVRSPTDDVTVYIAFQNTSVELRWTTDNVAVPGSLFGCTFTLLANTDYTVKAIWRKPIFRVQINGTCVARAYLPSPTQSVPSLTIPAGGNPSSSQISFDNYSIKIRDVEEDCIADLGPCIWPNRVTLPSQVKVTLANMAGSCYPGPCSGTNGDYFLNKQSTPDTGDCATYMLDVTEDCGLDKIKVHVVHDHAIYGTGVYGELIHTSGTPCLTATKGNSCDMCSDSLSWTGEACISDGVSTICSGDMTVAVV